MNPTGAFTFEAWVKLTIGPSDCRSVAGKNWEQAWWIGVCHNGANPILRSYLKGEFSQRNAGVVPNNTWTHIAVVFNGTQRHHGGSREGE